MKYKYGIYCSGGASRVIKFYQKNDLDKYKLEFILYDGNRTEIENSLKDQFGKHVFLLSYNNITKKESNIELNKYLLKLLLEHKIDYLFCFGDRIIYQDVLELMPMRIINFHPSILPSFPGLNAIDQALDSGSQILGNTAHFIDKGIDTGPIIMQSAINRAAVNNYEDVLELQLLMLEKIWTLLENDCIQVIEGKVMIKTNVEKNILMSI